MRAAFAARFLLVAAVAMASWVKGLAHGVKDRVKGGRDAGGTCATQVELNFGKKYEKILALGGSMAYYGNWITNHPNKAAIYAALFGELRPCLLRFRNTYRMNGRDAPITDEMRVDAELYAAAKATLGYAPTVLLTSWSPPAEFKESGQTLGGCPGTAIKSHADRGFVYEELARWWVDSVEAYRQSGVPVRYASLQNEPDYDTAGHDCCKFKLEEDRHSPGYNKLVFATHRLMHKEMQDPPGLVGPEHTKIDGYLPSGRLLEKLEAVGNHLYGSGDFEQPDSLLPSIRAAGKWAKANQKDLWCTEFGKLTDHETDDCLKLGQIVLNTLVLGGVSVYAHWDLFWGAGTGEGSLLLVENPWTPNDWKTRDGFRLTTSFWWFAHFSKFIRPGMFRVDGRSKSADVLVAAFGGDNSAVTVVIINKARNPVNGITLSGLPSSSRTAYVFQTTMTGKMERLGPLTDSVVPLLPARSITTVTTEI